ncbi:aldose 1-epimerase family protein [Olsenella urininfantis]|uniref:aldose 1-epimerase family protein n=1 Tax=Olsenella urininfantis TaxID=1871033 RepID=UPI001F21502F|nr:aldose 1-epimerase family protein [Olsenella urininfantis]
MGTVSKICLGPLQAQVDSLGAQLMSLSYEGREHLWQGNARWWPRRAPVLFPIVGSLRNGQATSSAGGVRLGRHGLARGCEFRLMGQEDSVLRYILASSARTREAYPFDFELSLTFGLSERGLEQVFQVRNVGDVELPFVLGGHPAFNVPVMDGEDFSQYRLEFVRDWSCSSPRIDTESGLLDFSSRVTVLEGESALPLAHELFDVDTLVLEQVPGRSVRLVGPAGHGVQLDFEGFDYLGVWSAANSAPFVALEPWTGCSTARDEGDVFEEKRGMTKLLPGESLERSFFIKPF